MKNLINKLFELLPWLKKNRGYYHVQRFRQYIPCKIDKSLTSRPDILDSLEKDGIVILESYVDQNKCAKILSELEEIADKVLQRKFDGNYSRHQLDQKAFRVGEIDEESPSAKEYFFNDEIIKSIAKAYVSKKAYSYRREADFKLESGHLLQADLPHFDDWRHRFKAFLYLTDVTNETAPFVYYKGSHKQLPWKYKYHLEFEMDGPKGRYGHFFVQEMQEIQQKYGYEKMVCTAKAGTLILADFRGIHSGTTMLSGRRILLNNTFGI